MQLPFHPFRYCCYDRLNLSVVHAGIAILCFVTCVAVHASEPGKRPDFDEVVLAADRYLASQGEYRNNDLLRQSQVEGVLKGVAAAGWKVDKADAIVELALPNNSFLVREFSTPAGRTFMRRLSSQPGAYAHLDRLSTIPRGQQMIRYLISKPGGEDLITYMDTTKGGQSLGKMMGGVRGGVDLNKSTRRIYTASELMGVLADIYQRENGARR